MSKEVQVTIDVQDTEDEIVVTEDEIQVVFTSDHSRSTNRDLPNQHPIKAINGLEEKLGTLEADVKLAKENKVTNIKTINGQSLIGSGNITIGAGGTAVVTSYPAKFKGKRLCILGDSISTFGTPNQANATGTWNYPGNRCRYPQDNLFTNVDYMYWKILLDKTGMEFGINESWAGSRVANTQASDSGDLGPNRCISSKTRIQHLGENGTPDVIIVYGGTNDIAGSTLGTFNPEAPVTFKTLGTAPSNPASLTDAQIDDLDVSTFANAYVAMLIRLQRYYPEAIIVCLTPNYCKSYYGSNYVKMKNYVNCMIEICDFFGVEYIDLRKVGIGLMDMAGDTYTEALPDGIHPGIKGHRLIAEYLFNVLDSHYFIPETSTVDIPNNGGGEAEVPNGSQTSITRTTTNSHAQSIPSNATASTNLAEVLNVENDYYGSTGWVGNGDTGVSITFAVVPGDKIKANSFGSSAENGYTQSGIRATFFNGNTCVVSKSPAEIYSEYSTYGYITIPSGVDAINVPFWSASTTENECYLLTMTDLSAGGTTSGGTTPEPETPSGGGTTTVDGITWHTSEIDDNGGPASFANGNVAVSLGYGWAQVEAFQALIRNKNINAVKFISAESSGVVTIGKTASQGATTGTLLATKSWNSSNKDSNGLVTVILDDTIKITGTEYIVFSYGQYGSPFKYKSSTTAVHGFYGRVPQVPTGGTGTAWSDASSYTLGVDYGYKG